MDEGTGTTANDSSGNNFNGTLGTVGAGGYKWTNGKFGNSLDFTVASPPTSNTGGYVNVPDNDIWSPITTGQFTVEAWVNMKSVTGDSYFVNKRTGSNYEWYLGYNNNNTLVAYITSLDGSTAYMATNIDVSGQWQFNRWNHVAFTFDDSIPLLRLYLNGQIIRIDTDTTGTYGNGTAPLRIGCDASGLEL